MTIYEAEGAYYNNYFLNEKKAIEWLRRDGVSSLQINDRISSIETEDDEDEVIIMIITPNDEHILAKVDKKVACGIEWFANKLNLDVIIFDDIEEPIFD